jgi:hypothetical protein
MRKILIPVALLALVATACGDALSGVGDLSRRIVHGDEVTSSTVTTVPAGPVLDLGPVTDLAWSSDGLERATDDAETVDEVLRRVWLDRGDGVTPFIQASRFEIERVLPGIEFPRLVPTGVGHVSSQLVYDTQTASLDVATSAAFGLWSVEPYSAPRSEAQLAVLRVGLKTFEDGDDNEYFSFVVADGREVSWTDGDYVYSLFCRVGVSEEACFAMAESSVPLSSLSVNF